MARTYTDSDDVSYFLYPDWWWSFTMHFLTGLRAPVTHPIWFPFLSWAWVASRLPPVSHTVGNFSGPRKISGGPKLRNFLQQTFSTHSMHKIPIQAKPQKPPSCLTNLLGRLPVRETGCLPCTCREKGQGIQHSPLTCHEGKEKLSKSSGMTISVRKTVLYVYM